MIQKIKTYFLKRRINKALRNPNNKKLSQAMLDGVKVAKENGIEQIRGKVFLYNSKNEICGTCALGNVILGVAPLEDLNKVAIDMNLEDYTKGFPELKESNTCFDKKEGTKPHSWSPTLATLIASCNDDKLLHPEKIAETLKECNL